MANFSSFQYKQAPLAVLQACDEIGIVKNPVKGESAAAFNAKIVCSTSFSSGDVSVTAEGNDAKFILNGKSGIDPSGSATAGDDIALYVRNGSANRVEFVQDITDKDIANADGDTLNIPQSVHYAREPQTVA